MDPLLSGMLGLLLGGVVVGFIVWTSLGAPTTRLELGRKILSRISKDAEFAQRVEGLLVPPPPPKPSGAAIRILRLLQEDARLIDFLLDNISDAAPEQIVAAVKEIHPKAQAALKKYLDIETVLPQKEGETVHVPVGFDPSAIHVTGNVTGQPPFQGTLLHAGWKVKEIHLTPTPEGQNEFILQPAEVELP